MRDDRQKWTPVPDHYAPLRSATVTVVPCALARQTLISGATAVQDAGPAIGWPDIAGTSPYRICLNRDQIFEVEGDAQATGWDAPSPI